MTFQSLTEQSQRSYVFLRSITSDHFYFNQKWFPRIIDVIFRNIYHDFNQINLLVLISIKKTHSIKKRMKENISQQRTHKWSQKTFSLK